MEDVRATDQPDGPARLVESERLRFVCECGDPGCRLPVFLTLAEYEAHRPDPIIHRDHERPRLRLVGT
jgi:hypothetical protein